MDPFEEEILHQLKETNKLPQSESNDEPKKATATEKSSNQNKNTSAVVWAWIYNTRNIFSHALPHYQEIPYLGINPPYYSFCVNVSHNCLAEREYRLLPTWWIDENPLSFRLLQSPGIILPCLSPDWHILVDSYIELKVNTVLPIFSNSCAEHMLSVLF